MGHDIRAFADGRMKHEIAYVRLFPSESCLPGNIYEVLGATNFRRSCSGNGEVFQYQVSPGHVYAANPNADASEFLSKVEAYVASVAPQEVSEIFIKFG